MEAESCLGGNKLTLRRIWSDVNKRFRKPETAFDDDYAETRHHFVARLKRTIVCTSPASLVKLIGAMQVRCERLKKAKGWQFEEGA